MCQEASSGRASLISTVTIPTCNRVQTLQRGICSYLENTRGFERTAAFCVFDDSKSASERQLNRNMLRDLRDNHCCHISYTGLEERIRFARRLLQLSDAPPEVVKFALFDPENVGVSTGANRNTLLLHTVGSLILSVDDDTFCRVVQPLESSQEIEFTPHNRFSSSHPCEVWVIPGNTLPDDQFLLSKKDVLSLHEEFLGKIFNRTDIDSTVDHCDKRKASGLLSPDLRVQVTLNGLAGDCAWATPSNYLFLDGRSLERLLMTEDGYRRSRVSRQIVRVATRPVISTDSNAPGLFAGFDNRTVLPPFMPVGRGQDTIFWRTLHKTSTEAAFADLPWAMMHCPPETRSFWEGEIVRSASGITLDFLMSALIQSATIETVRATPERNLQALGEWLMNLGERDEMEFEEFVTQTVRKEISLLLEYLDARLRETPAMKDLYRRDLGQFISLARGSLFRPQSYIPLDLLYGRDAAAARKLAQRLVIRYGQLLYWWPLLRKTSVVAMT